ncbi:MAG: MarR family EPS-associated transcriptional regulator [Arenicellales bacterium]|jgi:EPS-associated MarR family transcriptional regulator|nr:MarR family EPS-associated transcriptional regulator [Arenicellales bacterium]|tara:strand:- start:50 stop:379 length:330 start_codon:yes stop_codon:yes gene_type:complete
MTDPELQYRVLNQLDNDPHMTQRQLADVLGVSLGKTNYVVKALIDVGWLKLGNFRRSNNKMGYAYLLTPAGVVEKAVITKRFLIRKRQEYKLLALEIARLEVEESKHQE